MDPKLKSLSMGLQWNILRIFGSIPGPIALGAMLDGACSVWQYICGEQGACWIYDDDKIYKAVMIVRKSKTAVNIAVFGNYRYFSAVATKVVNIFCFGSAGYFFNVKEVPDVPTDGSGELGETNKSYENEKHDTTKEFSQSADL